MMWMFLPEKMQKNWYVMEMRNKELSEMQKKVYETFENYRNKINEKKEKN